MSNRTCSIDDCTRSARSRGWCGAHYERWRRHGDAEREVTPADRFWAKVDFTGPCWEWTASTVSGDYGHVWFDGRFPVAHRVAYELLVGPIPDGLTLDHLCRNTLCVFPDHLEMVTLEENIRRSYSLSAQRGRQTECIRGHHLVVALNGHRYCPTCRREAARLRTPRTLEQAAAS